MNETLSDSETPAHGQQVISVCAFIHRKVDGVEKVFLPKRAASKKFLPGACELLAVMLNMARRWSQD